MVDPISVEAFDRARRVMPGGVSSPVRAFRAVGGTPLFVRSAQGAWLHGPDGRRYVDYVLSWGPMILGHAHPEVLSALVAAAVRGTSFGAPTEAETRFAETIVGALPSVEMVRFVSSGTEAVMGALRLARGATARPLVVKCVGAYHGGADYLLVKAGSGAATLGEPDSAGVPESFARATRLVPHNDLEAVRALFEQEGERIAAVIVEPVAGNMGCVPPEPGWLQGLRVLTREHGALLVFDEVMTGFRVAWGGAQVRYGVEPDLTCLGKVVGGGMPLAAYAGPARWMERVAPLGPVYQAGTLSGNPVAVAAGQATLDALRPGEGRDPYAELEEKGAWLEARMRQAADEEGVAVRIQRVGSMLTVFFTEGPVRRFEEAARADGAAFAAFHGALLEAGVYWPPSPFEAAFLSLAHDEEALGRTARALPAAFRAAARALAER